MGVSTIRGPVLNRLYHRARGLYAKERFVRNRDSRSILSVVPILLMNPINLKLSEYSIVLKRLDNCHRTNIAPCAPNP